ncbi:DUF2089 domain-containing protein [bacterium]|nr:DUF2089 domain-containing protein [bacterium]
MNKMPNKCPSCENQLFITELKCFECGTTVCGKFKSNSLFYLTSSSVEFIELMLQKRGNLTEVAKELNISHPTVRNRLDAVLGEMSFLKKSPDVIEVVEKLESGEVTFEHALELIRALKGGK